MKRQDGVKRQDGHTGVAPGEAPLLHRLPAQPAAGRLPPPHMPCCLMQGRALLPPCQSAAAGGIAGCGSLVLPTWLHAFLLHHPVHVARLHKQLACSSRQQAAVSSRQDEDDAGTCLPASHRAQHTGPLALPACQPGATLGARTRGQQLGSLPVRQPLDIPGRVEDVQHLFAPHNIVCSEQASERARCRSPEQAGRPAGGPQQQAGLCKQASSQRRAAARAASSSSGTPLEAAGGLRGGAGWDGTGRGGLMPHPRPCRAQQRQQQRQGEAHPRPCRALCGPAPPSSAPTSASQCQTPAQGGRR